MIVKMVVAGQKFEYDIHETLDFDPEHVFDVIGKQPGELAWWFSLLAMKEQEVEDNKTAMDSKVSGIELDLRANSKLLEDKYGKVTEAVIKAELTQNQEVLALQKKYSKLRREAGLLKAMTKGFDSRSVLLATAGSAQRAELEARLRSLTGKASKESS